VSRFEYDGDGEEAMPYGLWQANLTRALGGRKGQAALAEMETALLALPEPKLIEGHLAVDGAVCAVGALVAKRRAEREGIDLQAVIDAMAAGVRCQCGHGRDKHAEDGCAGKGWQDRSCYCRTYEPDIEEGWETADAGAAEGLTWSVAYHLAYLNDEKFRDASPEERYGQMLVWLRRAQGKEAVAS
jgi:hypothetical protein